MRTLMLIATVLVFGVSSCTWVPENIVDWKVPATDPILAVGHGAFFDAKGQEFRPSASQVIEAQRFYIRRLYLASDRETQTRFTAERELWFAAKPAEHAEQVLMNAAQIDWLLERTQTAENPSTGSKNAALLSLYISANQRGELRDRISDRAIRPEVIDAIRRGGSLKFLFATTSGGADYIAQCREAGVPIPPDWGSNQWVSRGTLGTKFISQSIGAELFLFDSTSPDGVCMALPRNSGNSIKLLGIICLGTRTSKSCYWDNQRNKSQFDIPVGQSVPLSEFAGGGDLFNGSGGVCTDCHAGENPYVVHPGQPMDLGSRIAPVSWLQPLVHPQWPQNQGPDTILPTISLSAGDSSCLMCHKKAPSDARRFPTVSNQVPGYCSVILPSAISTTMPSSANQTPFAKHINALKAACDRPPPDTGVVVNGATQATPQGGRVEVTGNLSNCQPGSPDCPPGFCYFETLHGPFWQRTGLAPPYTDPAFRGSAARIYGENGLWKYAFVSDTTGMDPNAPPGGTMRCIAYPQIVGLPDASKCFANPAQVVDPDGTKLQQSINATGPGTTVNVISGFIGNVAQFHTRERPDTLRVHEFGGQVLLDSSHTDKQVTQYPVGPLIGESWTNGCLGWTPNYLAKDLYTENEIELVPAAQAAQAICYLTGITGAWSSTRDNNTVQPFAEIFKGGAGEIKLRTRPNEGEDRVGAYASCIAVK